MKTIVRSLLCACLILMGPAWVLSAPASTAKKPAAKKPAAKPKALFSSVRGKVEIKKTGTKAREVKKNSTASVGDRVTTSKDSRATLKFFDGTELEIGPKSDIRINVLNEGEKDKNLKFKLFVGKVLAKVKKLTSTRSSFEIEAGGVVCGVRGTTYSLEYDPATGNLSLDVDDGTVFSNFNGQTNYFNAGQNGEFQNGILQGQGNDGQQGNDPGKGGRSSDTGDQGQPGGGALGDLNTQFGGALDTGGDNTFNDPSVGGGVKVNVIVNVGVNETGP